MNGNYPEYKNRFFKWGLMRRPYPSESARANGNKARQRVADGCRREAVTLTGNVFRLNEAT